MDISHVGTVIRLTTLIQQMSDQNKPRYDMHKMRDKLGWNYDHVSFLKRITKPTNLHYKTLKAMVAKHDEYEKQIFNHSWIGLRICE